MIKARNADFCELSPGDKILVWFTGESSHFDYESTYYSNDWIEVTDIDDRFFCCPPNQQSPFTHIYNVVEVDSDNAIIKCEEDDLLEHGSVNSCGENTEWVLIVEN